MRDYFANEHIDAEQRLAVRVRKMEERFEKLLRISENLSKINDRLLERLAKLEEEHSDE